MHDYLEFSKIGVMVEETTGFLGSPPTRGVIDSDWGVGQGQVPGKNRGLKWLTFEIRNIFLIAGTFSVQQ